MSKVFIGTMDITSRYRDLAFCFKEKGYDAFIAKQKGDYSQLSNACVILDDSYSYYFKGVKPKRLQRWLQNSLGIRRKVLNQAIKDCDIFVFFWETLFLDFSDVQRVKEAGKTIVFCFVGSDVRHEKKYKELLFRKKRSFYDISSNEEISNIKKREFIRIAEKYGDAIFSRPDQSQLQTKPFYRMVPFVNLEDFSLRKKEQKEVPIITHAPTSNRKKGTQAIEKALERLKTEGVQFIYRPISKMKQNDVRDFFLEADIVIDQIYLLGGGKVSVEAMAQGCVAVSAMGYGDFESPYAEQAPIVDVSESNLKDVLKELIQNRSKRQEIADLGPDFVKRNANCQDFVDKMLAIHRGEDISPDFFPKPIEE